jgi:hypothetical protein
LFEKQKGLLLMLKILHGIRRLSKVNTAFYFYFSMVNFVVAFLGQKINGSGTRANESDPPHKN